MSELSKHQLAHVQGSARRSVEWWLRSYHTRGRPFNEKRMEREADSSAHGTYPHAIHLRAEFTRLFCELYREQYPKELFNAEITS